MARPLKAKTHDGVSSTGTSSAQSTKGHNSLSLYVAATNLDSGNDTVTVLLEVSPDGETWFPARKDAHKIEVTASELESDGVYMDTVHGLAANHARVNVESFTDSADDDLTLDTWLMFTNNSGTGSRPQSPGEP